MAEYIEREALKKRFSKRLSWLKKDIHDEYSGALYDGCETDAELIDEIPAADVVPVAHGRWIPFHSEAAGDIQYCSNCEIGYPDKTARCLHCGAIMDGGVDND